MTFTSYPAAGTGGLDIGEWGTFFEGFDGIIDDYTGTSLDLTRINTGEVARIAVGKVRVGGYCLQVTADHDLVVGTAAATYYIWACYDPALNVPDGSGNAPAAGACTLGISSGAPSTAGGKVYQLLYQIVRSASQALTATIVNDFRVWTGPTLHIPAATTIPSGILTDPITAITGFSYPVGTRLVYGSGAEYTVVKSTSGLKFERGAALIPDQQRYTTPGTATWTKPANPKYVFAQVQAGGGGGGGSQTTGSGESSAGSGGEGGGYAASLLDAAILASTVTVTVGAGGSASSGGSGGTGGASSFGAHVSATGGDGGSAAAGSASPVATSGGNSTQTLVGQIQIPGGGGGALIRLGTGQGGVGGVGGNSQLGNGGGGRGGDNAGLPGKNYGGGGGGAAATASQSTKAGGAGAPGIVIITTYS